MKDRDILKLKFGLATISLVLLLTGSKLLFDQWTSINWSFWFFVGLIIYGAIYPTFKTLRNKRAQIIFKEFSIIETTTYVGVIVLMTVMLLIFYPLISFGLFGLTIVTLSVFGGLKFITLDFDKKTVDGLFEERNLKITTVDIHSDNNEIEIKTMDGDDILLLKKEKYSDRVWSQLVDSFQKIK